jgi:outer membrane protein TolC
VRTLVGAVEAERKGAGWGGFGPQLQVGYQYGGISSDTEDQNFSLREQKRFSASAGWSFSLAVLGELKTAGAVERQAILESERRLDLVRSQVVRASQASAMNAKLVPMAKQQLAATEEALRLAQANLRAGTMLTVDVLQAEDAVDEARLRYADAVVRYNQAQVNLLAALGAMDAIDVADAFTEGEGSGNVEATTSPSTRPAQ